MNTGHSTLTERNDLLSLLQSGFMEQAFNFWFTDHDRIRSPFPLHIIPEVETNTRLLFLEWITELKENDDTEIGEDEFVETFESILFSEALKLVEDEDQKLTLIFPFLPRLGDTVNHQEHKKGTVISRQTIVSDDNKRLFQIRVSSIDSDAEWTTDFELAE